MSVTSNDKTASLQIEENVSLYLQPFEETAVFSIGRLNEQVAACDELLSRLENIENERKGLKRNEKQVTEKEEEIGEKYAESIKSTSNALNEAESAQADSETALSRLRDAIAKLKERHDALRLGQPLKEDLEYRDRVIEEKCIPYKAGIHSQETRIADIEKQLGTINETISLEKAELSTINSELDEFERGKIPARCLPLVEAARKKAADELEGKILELTERGKFLNLERAKLCSDRGKLEKEIAEALAKDKELKKVAPRGLFSKMASSAWWGSFSVDYEKKAKEATEKNRSLTLELDWRIRESYEVASKLEEFNSARTQVLVRAETAEQKNQHELCKIREAELPRKIKENESRFSELEAELKSRKKGLFEKKKELQEFMEQTTGIVIKERLEEIKRNLDKTVSGISAAESEVGLSRTRVLEITSSLEQIRRAEAEEKSVALKSVQSQLDGRRKALRSAEETLLADARNFGIEAAIGEIKGKVMQRRFELVSELNGFQQRDENAKPGNRKAPGAREKVGEKGFSPNEAPSQETAIATGNIYFDFYSNAEDKQNTKGRIFKGLGSQLEDLRRKLGQEFFPEAAPEGDFLTTFINEFFPEGFPQSYYISNLSVREGQPFLTLRPQMIGPRLACRLPKGKTLAICGRLWWEPESPVFQVQKIKEMSNLERRPFERLISVVVFSRSDNVFPLDKRRDNALSNELVSNLPLISVKTRDRLRDWHDYLDWKERLVHANLVGLRYLEVVLLEGGGVRFLTVCESESCFNQLRRILRSDELDAYDLDYSIDPWEFEFNEQQKNRGAELGDFVRFSAREQGPADLVFEGLPWDHPYFAYIDFRLPEDAQNEFDSIRNAGGTAEEAARGYLETVPRNGFLAVSIIGDISLIRRQRAELKELQEQSGYAPFLSSYLFDIKEAREPSVFRQIPNGQWFQPNLNDDQKLAVQKMISSPDLAMIQGPPGTGKTTMIAEATCQFAREGKKVLLVSQASLAVNNALERLVSHPAIRAVRLSRRERRNERAHPFSRERALETYYHNISDSCKNRMLDSWARADTQLKDLSEWLESVRLVSGDLDSLRDRAEHLADDLKKLNGNIEHLKDMGEVARSNAMQRADLEGFLAFLKGGDSFSGSVPDAILNTFYDRVIRILDRLPESGVRANDLWTERDYGSSSERSRFAVEALLNWRKKAAFKPQILGDLKRLQTADGDSVLSPEKALRLAELKRKFESTSKAMEEDESKVSEWQAIQKEIREIKRQGSGLDRETYSCLLNVEGSEMLRVLTSPESGRVEVVGLLEQIHGTLLGVETELTEAIDQVSDEIEKRIQDITVLDVDKEELRKLEGQHRLVSEQRREALLEISAKEKRLLEILERRPGKERSQKIAIPDLPGLLEDANRQLDDLKKLAKRNKVFREAWEPLLERWVKDLVDSETVRCDQEHFSETYVKACNVVGVTCTENRKTLEDEGHSSFDVVIVDEVSKATPTEIIMPLKMARTAILVGDHRQLPPLFNEHGGAWEEIVADRDEPGASEQDAASELNQENFDRFRKMVTASLFKEHFENAPDSLKSFLFTQYRMHPQIMGVVNQFYENRLKCGLADPDGRIPGSDSSGHRLHGLTLTGEQSRQYIVPERHVAWLDSTFDPCNKRHHERRAGTSRVNDLEGVLIAKALCDIELACREQGFGSNGKSRKEVGIVTFYGRQVRAIREAIRYAQEKRGIQFNAIEWDVNTVDRYQGQERPIILVSMVRNPAGTLSQRANTAQFERINVAFSRAQELLIVVGAGEVFCKYPVMLPNLDRPGKREIEVYRFIIDEIRRSGGYCTSDCILSPQEYKEFLPKQRANTRPTSSHTHRRGGK